MKKSLTKKLKEAKEVDEEKKIKDFESKFNSTSNDDEKLDVINSFEELDGLGQYIEDVVSGDLYEVLKTSFEEVFEYSLGEREQYKEVIMTVLFTKNGYNPKSKLLFASRYPFVDSVFRESKRKDYKALSKQLQRLESKLILRTVCKEINSLDSTIPMFTIHDSILTSSKHIETVKSKLIDILTLEIGFEPVIKVGE